ncbi:MAG: ribosome-associated translation inhibitor RaiA [Planctomycetota bacterium]
MRVEVIGRNIEATDAIRQHAEKRVEKLPRYFDGTQQITVTIEREGSHPATFKVEVVVDVEKHDNFVSVATDADVYAALDQAAQKSSRQLTDFKERLKVSHHRPS